MRDETQGKPVRSLQRPGRVRPSWRRRLAGLMVSIGVGAAIAGATAEITALLRGRDCASLARKAPVGEVIQACQQEFQRTDDPKTGARLADALRKNGDLDESTRLATSLLGSPARPDVLQVLGAIAAREDPDDALLLLETARNLHRLTHEPVEVARDAGLLAQIRSDRGEYVEALQCVDECISLTPTEEKVQQWYCHMQAGRALSMLGYFPAAHRELASAEATAVNDQQRLEVQYQRGSLAQEEGHTAEAIEILKDVVKARERSGDVARNLIAEENIAYALAELGNIPEAQQHLDKAQRLDVKHVQERERLWTAAKIAYEQHDLDRATALTGKYFGPHRDCDKDTDDSADQDVRIEVASLRARIELGKGDLSSAALWAKCAVDEAENVRDRQSLELRPRVLKKRRFAYELQFTALARDGRVKDAAMVFDLWQGRTVYDALARPRPSASFSRGEIADQIARLEMWTRASKGMFARRANNTAVLNTMGSIDLVAIIVADREVWRLTSTHGAPRLVSLGPLKKIRDQVQELASHPTDTEQAAALGASLLPREVFRETSEALHVVVDDQLTELPVAALSQGGVPVIAARPIVRELRLPEVPCVLGTRPSGATVLGDPHGNLQFAHDETDEVAARLSTTGKTGAAATAAALFAAERDGVLHIATRTASAGDGAALQLSDRDVPAMEIAARSLGQALVVLSNCSAATASSENIELIGSLSAGFIAGGARHVVATLRSVTDSGALAMAKRFYDARGVINPVRGLQAAQVELWKAGNFEWPIFTVFGPDVCL